MTRKIYVLNRNGRTVILVGISIVGRQTETVDCAKLGAFE